jgi:predicted esterase
MVEANLSVHHGRYDASVPCTHTWKFAQALELLGAKRFFCEIFDGGHEIRYDVAFRWFDALARERCESSSGLTG